MRKNTLAFGFLILLVLFSSVGVRDVSGSAPEPEPEPKEAWEAAPASTYSNMSVSLNTPTHQVIKFNIGEDNIRTEKPAQEVSEIPHLVLKRNGVLTPGYERTLEIEAHNVPVYAPGIHAILTITTQHIDPDIEAKQSQKIQIWRESQFIPFTELTQQGVRLNFTVTFDRQTMLDDKPITTPTDYYQYKISIVDMNGNVRQSHTENFAFLMENQWWVPLPDLLESEPGASPDRLLVYYYDMIPFQADMRNQDSQIPREDVGRYVQVELIPAMVQAIETQSNEWGFMWYPEWRNFRRDEDPKTLSVALGEHGVWFHGEAPSLGHSMISIRVDGSAGEYDTLKDGIMSIFHHELFHNFQRNISLHFNGTANVAGKNEAWMMFSEGTAVLASSVGQFQVQFEQTSTPRSYMKRANAFIGAEGVFGGGLNKNYDKIPYNTATYWRFLFEHCGGLEDTATGMGVIRTVLETLYKGEVVDIHASISLIEFLPRIMDQVLAESPSCPFRKYKESLSGFARAIYLLRVNGGHCTEYVNNICGFYDPHSLYPTPPVESAYIAERPATYISGNIPSSYGIDFVEVDLGTETNGKSLKVSLAKSSVSNAEFMVEVITIKSPDADNVALVGESNMEGMDGYFVFDISRLNLNTFDKLGLIIIRTDSNEKLDSNGGYTIQVMMH
jgi:hypothetical protein